jgi:capsular polysaccharide transport system permease protein
MSTLTATRGSLQAAAAVQLRVIGAIMMRELHTRFGRNNIGYLWLILEPMMLAAGVTVFHILSNMHLPYGMRPAPFYSSGYTCFIMFRGCILRSGPVLEANRALLYHRQITIFDLVFARCLLEAAATMFAMVLILAIWAALGVGNLPDRPLLLLLGMGLMFVFSLGPAMLNCAGCEWSQTVDRFVHPALYLMLPISGMFTIFEWIPPSFRSYMLWFPLPHILELVREGQFGNFNSPYVDVPYVLAWSGGLILLGFLALRVIRRHVEIE